MFEENNVNPHPLSPRRKACLSQCRIQKFINGGSVFDGNCTCWNPNGCWFNLQDHITELDHTLMWPDIKKFYRDLSTE
mgnify:CR=1 FL=1